MSTTTETDSLVLDGELKEEFSRNSFNPCVGTQLLSEGERSRIWFIRLEPGERLGFHRHVLDYSWTSLAAGKARSHINGGRPSDVVYFAGQTAHIQLGAGEFLLHDLENVGSTPLIFITVEHLDSSNPPIPPPAGTVPCRLGIGAIAA